LQERVASVAALRAKGEITVPSTIGIELATNPFMRCDQPQVRASAEAHNPGGAQSTLSTFTTLRAWKDHF
jgi:hydroxyacylglutathione hydrolase